jgi:hypothetical protein
MLLFEDFEELKFKSQARIRSLLRTVPFSPSGFRERMEAAFIKVQDTVCTPYKATGRGLPLVVHGLPPVASREQHDMSIVSPDGPPIDFWERMPTPQSQRKESDTRANASTTPRTKGNAQKPKMFWTPEETDYLKAYMAEQSRDFLRITLYPWVQVKADTVKGLGRFHRNQIKDKWTVLENKSSPESIKPRKPHKRSA